MLLALAEKTYRGHFVHYYQYHDCVVVCCEKMLTFGSKLPHTLMDFLSKLGHRCNKGGPVRSDVNLYHPQNLTAGNSPGTAKYFLVTKNVLCMKKPKLCN